MEKLKGGIAIDREKFSNEAQNLFDIAINHRRQLVTLSNYAISGYRFNDNNDVLARLESMFSEIEFMICPGLTIDKALIDAAQADYWYEKEKQYDDSIHECEIGDE